MIKINIKVNKEQKKLLKISAIVLGCIIIFIVFIYNPKKAALVKIKSYVEVTNSEIKEIKEMIGESTPLEIGVGILQERAYMLKSRYITQDNIPMALKILSDNANRTGVRILSTRPQAAGVFANKQGVTPKYDSATCMKLPLDLITEGKYEDIVKFLYLLENGAKGIYTVDGFSLRQDNNIYPEIKVDLKIGLYYFAGEK